MGTRFLGVELNGKHLLAAIHSFDQIGRKEFLRRYGFDRSSKFYLKHGERIYDTKALLSATYYQATGRRLSNSSFSGGAQTTSVLDDIIRNDYRLRKSIIFEDKLGELSYLTGEYDQLAEPYATIKKLGFSKWIPLKNRVELKTGFLPGVYIVGYNVQAMGRLNEFSEKVVYIGETVSQSISKRLYQFEHSLKGKSAHSGGYNLFEQGYRPESLSVSIRSFTLPSGVDPEKAKAQRSALIRFLERKLLYEYVTERGCFPIGNSK